MSCAPCTLLYVHGKKWAASAAEGLLLHLTPLLLQILFSLALVVGYATPLDSGSLQGTLCLSWAHAAPGYTLAITSQVDVATSLAAAEATIAPLA